MDEYRKYRAELDAILLNGSPGELRRFMIRHGQIGERTPLATIELTFHKTITAATSLPVERRRLSKAWLEARGSHSLDDGDL